MYINGVWQNPYLTDMAIAFTPHTLKSSSKTVQFKLPSNTWLSNIKNQISSIQLNANNGAGYQTITIDQYLTLEFYVNKTYDLDFKITRTNGSVYYSHSKFAIHDPTLESVEKAAIINNDQTQVYIYDETMENGLYRGATLTIRRGPDPNNITRPFIVVEGFDAGHITDPADFGGD
jgi:hypothetical protein